MAHKKRGAGVWKIIQGQFKFAPKLCTAAKIKPALLIGAIIFNLKNKHTVSLVSCVNTTMH